MLRHTATAALTALTVGCATEASDQRPVFNCETPLAYRGEPTRASIDVTLPAASVGESIEFGTERQASFANAFDRAFEATGAASMTAAVLTDERLWSEQRGAPEGQLHYWASVGKIVTAATILQLETEGRVSLDDRIGVYVEGVPNGDLITLQMLLNHTSGLFSANEDEAVRAQATPLSLEEELAVLRSRGAYACPGAAWRYSNSGYQLLGAVIEQVTGTPFHAAAQSLVLDHSRADTIHVLSRDADLADVAPPTGDAPFDMRGAQAAGGVVADATSMAIFLQDLLGGRILEPSQVELMTATLYPMFEDPLWYGLGLMVFDVPHPEGASVWIGHSGGVPGAKAVVAYEPARGAIAAVALTGDGSAEASANLFLQQLDAAR